MEEHGIAIRDLAGVKFPRQWGAPVGAPGSEERALWIAESVRRFAPASGTPRAKDAMAALRIAALRGKTGMHGGASGADPRVLLTRAASRQAFDPRRSWSTEARSPLAALERLESFQRRRRLAALVSLQENQARRASSR